MVSSLSYEPELEHRWAGNKEVLLEFAPCRDFLVWPKLSSFLSLPAVLGLEGEDPFVLMKWDVEVRQAQADDPCTPTQHHPFVIVCGVCVCVCEVINVIRCPLMPQMCFPDVMRPGPYLAPFHVFLSPTFSVKGGDAFIAENQSHLFPVCETF